MSVHKKGKSWVTRWDDENAINPETGKPRQRAKAWPTKALADAHERKIKEAKAVGEFAYLERGGTRLSDFAREEWKPWVEATNKKDGSHVNLAPKTQKDYIGWWTREIEPRIGRVPLKMVTPEVIDRWQRQMADAGVPVPTQWSARKVLDSILTRATYGWITHHPGANVKRPKRPTKPPVRPWTPERVEAIRAAFLRSDDLMWAVFVSVMAYAGLRPEEAWRLEWSDVGVTTISFLASKTDRARSIPMCSALASDLLQWRLESRRNADGDPIFYGERTGETLRDGSKNNWWGKRWPNALKAAGVPRDRPYVLRHSIVSLWIAEGHSLAEVARRAGHSQRQMLDTYSHLFEEWDTREKQNAEALIVEARGQWSEAGLPISFPHETPIPSDAL